MNDNLEDINTKLDHLMRVTAELFIMIKSNSILETKLDQCIKSINTMNSSLTTIINNQNNRPKMVPPFPRGIPRSLPRGNILPPYKKPTKDNNKKTCSGGYMSELKQKLKERNLKNNIII
jgi:hypothetical protein